MTGVLRRLTMGCVCSKESVDIDGRRFYIRQRLGEGGFSYVDMIEESKTHKLFALKRIACHSKTDEDIGLKEVEYMRCMRHPNLIPCEVAALVPLTSTGHPLNRSAQSEVLIAMPYYWRGGVQDELEGLSKKGTHMAQERLLRLFKGVCNGVKALHTNPSNPLTHRDLKPHNVMLDHDDTPVIMDFGSMGPARVEVNGSADAMRMTDFASERCSMPYRAPELFNVESYCTIDEKIDIWSLGCTLYAMCFHESPFDKVYQRGDSIALAVMAGKINIPSNNPYSNALTEIILAMLIVNPTERPDIHWVLKQVETLAELQENRV